MPAPEQVASGFEAAVWVVAAEAGRAAVVTGSARGMASVPEVRMEHQVAAQRSRPGGCNQEPEMSVQLELEPVELAAPVEPVEPVEPVAPVEPAGLEPGPELVAPGPELVAPEPEPGLVPEPELAPELELGLGPLAPVLGLEPAPPEQLAPEPEPEVAAAAVHIQPPPGQDTAAGPALVSAPDIQALAAQDTQRPGPGWGSWCTQ